MKIGYGQMDAQVNSNLHDHSFGCVVFVRKPALNIVGISLRLAMEKENMTVQGHEKTSTSKISNEPLCKLTFGRERSCSMVHHCSKP